MDSKNITEILNWLFMGGGMAAIIGFFTKIKSLKKENKKLKDEKQDKLIQVIEEKLENNNDQHAMILQKVSYLYDTTKNSRSIDKLDILLSKKAQKIYKIKKLNNAEMRRLINNQIQAYYKFIEFILKMEFEISLEDAKEQALEFISNADALLKTQKLNLPDSKSFLNELDKTIIRPDIDNLILQLSELTKLENGERRAKLESISISYNLKNIYRTIDLYHKYKNI